MNKIESLPLRNSQVVEEYENKPLSETEGGPVGFLGTEAPLSPISCRQDTSLHDLPWVPKGRFIEQLLIKGGAARKQPEARLKLSEKLIKIRRPTTWDEIKGVQALHTP